HLCRFSADQRFSIEHAFIETLEWQSSAFAAKAELCHSLKFHAAKTTEDIAEYADFRRNSGRYPGVSVRNC
ncbi:MAG: hypothetical protein RBT80_23200, partial [Candidatus Vecturithrix sp.]|nr:hypothetical protein [Candidatus Vecturithrix sp.]